MKKIDHTLRTKRMLLGAILLFMSFPFVLQRLDFGPFGQLGGYFMGAPDPDFTAKSWMDGDYQPSKELWLKENNAYYTGYIRIKNQIDFSYHKIANVRGVIVGKEDFLFEEGYMKGYYGDDFIGEKANATRVEKLRKIEDTLQSMGIELISVLAPGKASFYDEYFPDEYKDKEQKTTNYEVLLREMRKNNVQYLDFKSWFLAEKETAKYPLFPKTGIHWSVYGELMALDSILKYMGSLPHLHVPEMVLKDVHISTKMQKTDQDIEDGMNLLTNIPDLEMAYPTYDLKFKEGEKTSKTLVVADSYYFGIYMSEYSEQVFGNGEFWYYFKQIHPIPEGPNKMVEDIDMIKALEGYDAVILLSTDANMHSFGFGFIEEVYSQYFPGK